MPSKTEQVEQAVVETKEQLQVPSKIDANTTITDVRAEGELIWYELTGIDPARLSEDALKPTVAPTACGNADVKDILDKDISLQYYYTVEGSSDTYEFTVTKADC